MPRKSGFLAALLVLVLAPFASSATAAITASPSTVSAFPTQTTSPITLTLTFSPTRAGGTGTISVVGLPFGVTTIPSPLSYTYAAAGTTATTSVQFALSASASPGTYAVEFIDATLDAGLTTANLTVRQPTYSASASPNPVTIPIGSSRPVTVSTTTEPGFNEAISYSFSGFPAFITTGGAQSATAPAYAPLSFPFAVAAGATPGTYSGALTGRNANGATTGTFPFTVIVQQPDIAASFSQPSLALCNGGPPANDSVTLAPLNGYSGTPQVEFTSVPAGITITPVILPAASMPPAQTIPFTVRATAAAAGTYAAMLNVADPTFGINKTLTLVLNVGTPDFTQTAIPALVSLTAGGGGQAITATIAPNACFSASGVNVTASGMPTGLTITPAQAVIGGPAYSPVSFVAQASAGVAAGSYPVVFTFAPSDGTPSKQSTVTFTVAAAPDFLLSASPSALAIQAGNSGTITITATGVNGFSGTVNVTSPSLPGIAFSPAVFAIPAGGSQNVTVTVSPAAAVQTSTAIFSGTAVGITGTRATSVALTVTAGPDFELQVQPSSLAIAAGESGQVAVSVVPLNGFTGTVSITAPVLPGVTFTPAQFPLAAGASQTVTIATTRTTPPSTQTLLFSGIAAGVSGPRTAALTLTVTAAPDFSLAVMPSTLTIVAGGSGTVSVSAAAINGYSGPILVTAQPSPGVTVNPAAFTILPGASQNVTIAVSADAAPGGASVVFTGSAPSIGTSHNATAAVNVSPRPDFSLVVTPASITIPALGSTTISVSIIGVNGFTGPVMVTMPLIPGLAFSPTTFALSAGGSQTVGVSVPGATTPPGPQTITISAVDPGSGLAHTANLVVTLLPPLPQIVAVTPPAVVNGTRSIVVRLAGNYFQGGAAVSTPSSAITIENVTVLSPTLADVTLSVRADGAPGAYILTLTNPDGGATLPGGTLLVYPSSSIGAPLDVTAAAIVFPAQGTMIAAGTAVYPRGLLATTGTGTIVGSWNFDGVPFDRFVVTVGGGMPAEVRAHVPIPISYNGGHRLELVVELPRHAVSPAVNIIAAIDSVSRLTILAPRDGAVVNPRAAPVFRWSLVPNASGYLVEIDEGTGTTALPDTLLPLRKVRLSQAEWAPSARELGEVAPGVRRWRVRAVFAGETEGEPTGWNRFALLPERLTLVVELPVMTPDGQTFVRWSGGAPGVLYRVDFLAADGKVVFSGLSPKQQYIPPLAVAPLPLGFTVRVTALGPGGIVLGTSTPAKAGGARRKPASRIALVQSAPTVTTVEPADGATVTMIQPTIAATWSGSVAADQVSLVIDTTDVTAVSMVTPSSVRYESLLALEAGAHTVRLGLGTALTTWTFMVQPQAATTPAPGEQPAPETEAPPDTSQQPATTPPSNLRTDWAFTPIGTITVLSGAAPGGADESRAQFSAQTDLATDAVSAKLTGDVSVKHELDDPNRTYQESRNWLAQLGATQGGFSQQAIFGFAPPDFVDQSELLSTGLARGGAEGKVSAPFGSAAYYETLGFRPVGVVAGNFGPEQKVRAFALRSPVAGKWDVRGIGMRVTDEPGFNSAGGEGEAFGIFAKYAITPTLGILLEGARGSFDPNPDSAESRREGNAFRLGFTGTSGTLAYGFNLRKTDADYVNPANRGFTPGGVPDRMGGDVSLSKIIGRTSVSVQLRHLQDGTSSGALIPTTRENGGVVSLMSSLGTHVSVVVMGNITTDKGAGIPSLFLPATDRKQAGGALTLTEMAGRFMLSQTYTLQQLRDRVTPVSDQTIHSAMLSGGGRLTTNFNLMTVISGTRAEGDETLSGTTEQFLVSIQPTWAIPPLSLSFQPRAQYSRSSNDLTSFESTTEQYQGLVTWSPSWLRSLLSVQVTADWSRNEYSGQITKPEFEHRYIGSLSLRWGAGSGAATPSVAIPGAYPIAAPAEVSTSPAATPGVTAVSQ